MEIYFIMNYVGHNVKSTGQYRKINPDRMSRTPMRSEQVLARTIKVFLPKYLFLSELVVVSWLPLRKKNVIHANRTSKFQVFRSNVLLVELKFQ